MWVADDAKVSWLAIEFVDAPAATVGAGGSSLSVGVLSHQCLHPVAFRRGRHSGFARLSGALEIRLPWRSYVPSPTKPL